MADFYVKSGSGTAGSGTFRGMWVASTTYAVGDRVVTTRSATAARQHKIYECTTGGAAGGSEPTWVATDGNTTTDNAATWTCRAPTTWANAHMFLDMLCGATLAAGDTVYVSDNHAETSAVSITIATQGTAAAPTKIICVDDTSGEPPTTLATTGSVTTTGNTNITITAGTVGSCYLYGLNFYCGNSSGAALLNLNPHHITAENCHFELPSTTNNTIRFSIACGTLKNCTFKFNHAGQGIGIGGGSREGVRIEGGSILSGGTAVTSLVQYFVNDYGIQFIGFDLSNAAQNVTLSGHNRQLARYINCKLPASWNGVLASGTANLADDLGLFNCDSGDTNYNLIIKRFAGDITDDTGIYNDAGATDGTTRLSWKMVTNANAEWPHLPLVTTEIVKWNDTTGSSVTATVEIVHNSQGSGTNGVLNDDEIWLEVMYLGTSGYPLGTWTSNRKAILGTAAAPTTSSAAWTGDSAGWDTQKLEVTFTPQEKGYVHARVCLAKASATVYVDPLITLA